jgi:hypothetical protein
VRAWAKGLLCLEAAAELLIGHRSWLSREDFLAVAVESGRDLAAVDFVAAACALEAGVLPCSGSESQVLRVAASIAAGVPVDLREALTGLDAGNVVLAARAICHAAGYRAVMVAEARR